MKATLTSNRFKIWKLRCARARELQMNCKLALRPRGWHVPSYTNDTSTMWWESRIVAALNLTITLPLSPIFIPLCNSHIQSLKLNYLSLILICGFLVTASALPSTTKPLIHTAFCTTIHHTPPPPTHCKGSLPYSQLQEPKR